MPIYRAPSAAKAMTSPVNNAVKSHIWTAIRNGNDDRCQIAMMGAVHDVESVKIKIDSYNVITR